MSILDPDALWRYIAIFSTLLAAGFGFPIPEEIPVVTAGVMVARNDILDWWVMVPVCIAGVVIGDMVLYTIGRLWGSRLIVHPWVQRKLITPATRRRIERNFHEYGVGILLAARLMPGVRSPVFIMAGVIRMPWWKFLLADGIYAIPGVNLLFWLAYIFTDQFVELVEKVENVRPLIIVLVLAVATGVLLY
ncbi:MAG TPA: DedA family protein, partial [Gemmataceae bacterium]